MSTVDVYLPPQEPTDNAPPARPAKATRTTLFWLVVVVAFIAYYYTVAGPSSAAAHPRTESAFSVWPWIPLVLLVAGVFWLWRQLRGSSKFNDAQVPGLLALADGDLEHAHAIFEDLVGRYGSTSNGPSVRLNLAFVQERMGRWEACRDTRLAVERSPGAWSNGPRIMAGLGLCRTLALRGDVDRAAAWLADAKKRVAKHSRPSLFLVGELRLVEAILLARRGALEPALAILEQDWRRLESGMNASHLKHGVLLRAYLTSIVGGARGEGNATPWLMQLRTSPASDTAFMYDAWPELATWVQAQGLAARAA
ncbi:MAG: hypothetical protein ABI321_00395 [Polyangia bacterium]